MADNCGNGRLSLGLLQPSQYKQVAEWEWGPLPANTDWGKYIAEMNAPQWAHFALYDGAAFVGCISLEKIDRQMIAFHVVTARRKIHPQGLAEILLDTAGDWFASGYTAMAARIPREKRAAAKLAMRCGMREWGHTPAIRYFILTKNGYSRRTDRRLAQAA